MKTAEDFLKELKEAAKERAAAEHELGTLKKTLEHLKEAAGLMTTVSLWAATLDDMTKVELTIANLESRQEILQTNLNTIISRRRQIEHEFQTACKAALKK